MKKIDKLALVSFILSVVITIIMIGLTFAEFQEGNTRWGIFSTIVTLGWVYLSILDFKRIKSSDSQKVIP